MSKITIDSIIKELKEINAQIQLKSTKYNGVKNNLDFYCNVCEVTFSKNWTAMKRSKSCPSCKEKLATGLYGCSN